MNSFYICKTTRQPIHTEAENAKESDMRKRQKAASTLRYVSMGLMTALTLTQLIPSLELAGIAVWIGLASFFIIEAIGAMPAGQSGLRFSTMGGELKNGTVWFLIGLLACIQIIYVLSGYLIFGHAYIDYDMGRIFDVMKSDSIMRLLVIIPLSAWGEEIAWRGFFLSQKPEKASYLLWALCSSVLFAIGHVSQDANPLVLFGTSSNLICSLILCGLFHQTKNCMISTVGHIIGNYAEIILILTVFWK